jgi:hypothetical protein
MRASRSFTDFLLVFIIGVCIGLLVSQRACNDSIIPPNDTTYIVGKSDTIVIHDTTLKEVIKPIAVTKYKYVHDTIYGIDTLVCDTVRNYIDSLEDGTCKAVYNASVRGQLLGWSANLMSRKMEINRVDTIKITLPTKDRFRLGIGASLNDSLQPSGYIIASKRNINFLGSYNFKRKEIAIGVGINLLK